MASYGPGKFSVRSTARSLGPMLFALVLHKLVTSIEVDDDCLHLILEAWYLDDGVLARERSAVIRALHLIEELGPYLGLHINFSKCKLFSRNGNSHFPPVVESSLLPNMDILGVPIGDFVHCSRSLQRNVQPPKSCLKLLWTSLQLMWPFQFSGCVVVIVS